jgi:hypothetical protein
MSIPEPPDSETLWTNEKIVAYRGWEWLTDEKVLRGAYGNWDTSTLRGVHQDDPGLHKSPHWGCLCGVNAYKDVPDARNYPILGQVELSGVVIEYDAGYRAEVGHIIHLAVWTGYLEMVDLNVQDLRDKYPDVIVTTERKIPWRK